MLGSLGLSQVGLLFSDWLIYKHAMMKSWFLSFDMKLIRLVESC